MEEPEQYSFFRSLDISIIELVVNQLTAAASESKDDSASFIEWSEFFDLFCKLRESATQQAINVIRSKWHPATMGFSMEKADQNEHFDNINEESGRQDDQRSVEDEEASAVSDNYTEDSGSESSTPRKAENNRHNDQGYEEDNQSNESRSDRSVRNERHVASIHPCFIGYSAKTSKELEHERKEKQKVIHEREIRAITKARRFCEEKLAALEKQVNTRSQQRKQKIESLKVTFEETTVSRKREFDDSAAGTTEDIFRSIKVSVFFWYVYYRFFLLVFFLSTYPPVLPYFRCNLRKRILLLH
jgi:hypothetical protein